MPFNPKNKEELAREIASRVRSLRSSYAIEEIDGVLFINNQRFSIDTLYRRMTEDSDCGAEILQQYIEDLINNYRDAATTSFNDMRTNIMPRIHHEKIFQKLDRDMLAYVPFVNDTVIVFVQDLKSMIATLKMEDVKKWGITLETLEDTARANLDARSSDLEVTLAKGHDDKQVAVFAQQDGYDSARLLLLDLHECLAPMFGGDFYVSIPSRDMFMAFPTKPRSLVARIKDAMKRNYEGSSHPITPDLFYVTRDGIAGTSNQ